MLTRSSSYDNSSRPHWKRQAKRLLQLLRHRAERVSICLKKLYQADVGVSEQRPKVKRKTTRRAHGNTVASAPEEISIILMVAVVVGSPRQPR